MIKKEESRPVCFIRQNQPKNSLGISGRGVRTDINKTLRGKEYKGMSSKSVRCLKDKREKKHRIEMYSPNGCLAYRTLPNNGIHSGISVIPRHEISVKWIRVKFLAP